jgi:lysophospholipase L1-like esterase
VSTPDPEAVAPPEGSWDALRRPRTVAPAWTSGLALGGLLAPAAVAPARDGGPALLLALAVVAGASVARRHRLLAAAVPAAAGVLAVPIAGAVDGAVLVAAALAWLVIGARHDGPDAARVGRLRPAAAVLAVLGGAVAGLAQRPVAGLVLIGAALAVRAAAAIRPLDRLLDPVERVTGRVARAISAVLCLPALAIVVVRWATDRLVGYDVRGPSRHLGRWHPRAAKADPRLLVGPTIPDRPGRRWHRRLAGAAFAVAVLVPLVPLARRPDPVPRPPAVADQPHWSDTYRESDDITARLRPDPVTFFTLPSYRGRWVNEDHGVRRTWRPPACSCRRLRVWWFGGSAAWGMYQRDEWTLPSQLARVAWDHGIALDIENRAIPGFVVAQEVRAFQEALAEHPPPDLVVFFDGNNDVDQQLGRNDRSQGRRTASGPDIADALGPVLRLWDAANDLRTGGHRGRVVRDHATDAVLDARTVAAVVAGRYRDDARLARQLAAANGAEAVFAWQPTVATTPVGTGEPGPQGGSPWVEAMKAVPPLLDHDVIDLSGSLARTTEPLFVDATHTSERGARLVATALYRALADRLPPAGD